MNLENSNIPQETPLIIKDISGNEHASASFINAYKSGKFAHSWIITGPKGIGKAQLAIRTAHYILSHPEPLTAPDLLDPHTPNDPVYSQILANSHPDLFILRREMNQQTGKLRLDISVNDARKVGKFFSRRASGEGWRVCIIDTADDLNIASANALLKIVEEPPQKSLILFISNSLGRLLPTLRSRCRVLKCASLSEEDLSQALSPRLTETAPPTDLKLIVALSEGSLTRACELTDGGLEVYQGMMACLETLPTAEWSAINKFVASLAGAANREKFTLFADMFTNLVQRLAINSATETWNSALEREEQLSTKWQLPHKKAEFLKFTLWLEAALRDRLEYNLDPSLTATEIFQRCSNFAKSGDGS